ncbi:MAG: helix-turn-helix transcriptional regulator [Ectothiorhodospiraceae bacterium]|nr:helix-turn-helix transcriptional regulator [Ectothiorhodospiraceae bacterium]
MPEVDYQRFRERVAAWQPELVREVFRQHQHLIRVKKEEVALDRLDLILRTALDISNRKGFKSMSVRDLSEATGISMGALYAYIDSKDGLLDMIMAYGSVAARWAVQVPDQVVGARSRLDWVLRSHLYLSEVLLPWFFFAFMEARHFSQRAREQAMGSELWMERLISECLEEGNASGEFAVARPDLAGALIKSLLQDWYLKRWKYRRRNVDVEAYTGTVMEFIEAWVLPDRSTAPGRVQTDQSSRVNHEKGSV